MTCNWRVISSGKPSLYVSQRVDKWVVSWTQAFIMHICIVAPPAEYLRVKADIVLFAGYTVWSICEHVRRVRKDALYKPILSLPLLYTLFGNETNICYGCYNLDWLNCMLVPKRSWINCVRAEDTTCSRCLWQDKVFNVGAASWKLTAPALQRAAEARGSFWHWGRISAFHMWCHVR